MKSKTLKIYGGKNSADEKCFVVGNRTICGIKNNIIEWEAYKKYNKPSNVVVEKKVRFNLIPMEKFNPDNRDELNKRKKHEERNNIDKNFGINKKSNLKIAIREPAIREPANRKTAIRKTAKLQLANLQITKSTKNLLKTVNDIFKFPEPFDDPNELVIFLKKLVELSPNEIIKFMGHSIKIQQSFDLAMEELFFTWKDLIEIYLKIAFHLYFQHLKELDSDVEHKAIKDFLDEINEYVSKMGIYTSSNLLFALYPKKDTNLTDIPKIQIVESGKFKKEMNASIKKFNEISFEYYGFCPFAPFNRVNKLTKLPVEIVAELITNIQTEQNATKINLNKINLNKVDVNRIKHHFAKVEKLMTELHGTNEYWNNKYEKIWNEHIKNAENAENTKNNKPVKNAENNKSVENTESEIIKYTQILIDFYEVIQKDMNKKENQFIKISKEISKICYIIQKYIGKLSKIYDFL
jgi:hypothetical protein